MRRFSTTTSRGAAEPTSPVQTMQFLKWNRVWVFCIILVVLRKRTANVRRERLEMQAAGQRLREVFALTRSQAPSRHWLSTSAKLIARLAGSRHQPAIIKVLVDC